MRKYKNGNVLSFLQFSLKRSKNEHISNKTFFIDSLHVPENKTFKFGTSCITILVDTRTVMKYSTRNFICLFIYYYFCCRARKLNLYGIFTNLPSSEENDIK